MTHKELNALEQEANGITPKVYCQTCVSFRRGRDQYLCLHPNAVTTADNFLRTARYYGDPAEHNADNDCPDYTRTTVRGIVRIWWEHWDPILALLLGAMLLPFVVLFGLL